MPDNILSGLSAKQLRQAAALREQIDRLSNQLAKILGGSAAPAPAAKPTPKPKRTMSAAARAKIAAAQRRRWAKQKKAAKDSAVG